MRSLAIMLCLLLMAGCGKNAGLPSTGKTDGPPSADKLSSYNIAGLRINLPSTPQVEYIPLPPEAKELIMSNETYKIIDKDSNTRIGITRVAYKQSTANLEGSADGAIAQVRAQPGVTGFTSSKSRVIVDGLQGYQIEALYGFRNSKHRIIQFGLNFTRKNVLWQIQIVGDATYNDSVRTLKEEIFSSVKLSKH